MASQHLIREARRRAGLTQSELAERARTTQSAIARWESGRSTPSLEKLMVLVACCGLELSLAMSERRDAEWTLLARRRLLPVEDRLEQLLSGAALREPIAPRADDTTAPHHRFDPRLILATLHAHQVRHVVIGALAAALHGSPLLTDNVDITPAIDDDNLRRLESALDALGVQARTAGGTDREAPQVLTRVDTTGGSVGVVPLPAGTAGYDDLRVHAVPLALGGTPVLVAALHDVIRSKEAAARSQDRLVLPTLRRLQQLVDRP
jgi:transcriptional regulator with XRE-family HTH domain